MRACLMTLTRRRVRSGETRRRRGGVLFVLVWGCFSRTVLVFSPLDTWSEREYQCINVPRAIQGVTSESLGHVSSDGRGMLGQSLRAGEGVKEEVRLGPFVSPLPPTPLVFVKARGTHNRRMYYCRIIGFTAKPQSQHCRAAG